MKFIDWFIGESLDKTDDSYERVRIKMNFQVWLAFVVILSALSTLLIITGDDIGLLIPVSFGLTNAFVSGIFIKKGRSDIAAFIITFFGWGIVVYAIFSVINPLPVDGGLWLALFVVYAYFMHGKKVGIILGIASVILYAVFILYFLKDNLDTYNRYTVPQNQYIIVITIVLLIFVVFGRIITAFIDARNEVERKLMEKMDQLSYQNNIIESQNNEKTIMMNEIHHRVKNNLQVINSLLRIQSNKLEDSKSIEVFNEAQNRVIAMALIHEEMYRNKSLDRIDFANYIQNLSREILDNSNTKKNVELDVNSEVEFIDNKTMVPLGLILNELIINSVKHGFQTDNGNTISIDFVYEEGEDEKGAFLMKYKDNGIGFNPEQVDSDKSFGLEMIEALSEQLNAVFKIHEAEKGVFMSLEIS